MTGKATVIFPGFQGFPGAVGTLKSAYKNGSFFTVLVGYSIYLIKIWNEIVTKYSRPRLIRPHQNTEKLPN